MAEFEILEDVTKAIPKGKDLKKMTPFIVVGAGLGLIALFMNRSNTGTDQNYVSDDVESDVDLGGIMTDFANQTNQAIEQNNQEMSYQMSEVAGNLFDVVASQNDVINQLTEDLQNQINEVNTTESVPIYQQASLIQSVTASPTTTESSGSSIYFDGVDDDLQYNNVVKNVSKAVSSKQISKSEGDTIKKSIAGLGNNGEGWTYEGATESRERLKNDSSYVKSEIERADLVIENRKASGLSTKAQEEYKSRLVSGKEWAN